MVKQPQAVKLRYGDSMPKGTTADQLNQLQQKYDKLKKRHDELYGKFIELLDLLQALQAANKNDE